MKTGMNLLLWTDHVTEAQDSIIDQIKELGFDAVEIPIFATSDLAPYQRLGKRLQSLGLGATAVTVMGPQTNPISSDPKVRDAAVAHLDRVMECGQQFGCEILCGPLHSAIGVFSGTGPTDDEFKYGVETLQRAAEKAQARNIVLAMEFLNRFENYFLTTTVAERAIRPRGESSLCKMMYDSFHAHIEEKNQADAIVGCAAETVHVHISENDRGTPGTGQVDWSRSSADSRKLATRLPDDRGVRHGPAGPGGRDPGLAQSLSRRHGALPRGPRLHEETHGLT